MLSLTLVLNGTEYSQQITTEKKWENNEFKEELAAYRHRFDIIYKRENTKPGTFFSLLD